MPGGSTGTSQQLTTAVTSGITPSKLFINIIKGWNLGLKFMRLFVLRFSLNLELVNPGLNLNLRVPTLHGLIQGAELVFKKLTENKL